jgi:hypothetical protein
MTQTQPFRHWIFDGYFQPVGPLPASLPWEVKYGNDLERDKRTLRDVAALPDDFREVFAELTDPASVNAWARRLDVPGLINDPMMHGAGLHVTDPGGWLQVHVDYERHPRHPDYERRLSLIAFLHPEWRPEWGGQLLLCDPSGEPRTAIDPLPGRLVAFEGGPTSYHGVRPTTPEAPPRISAAVYYLARTRPHASRLRALFMPNRQSPACPAELLGPVQKSC